MMTKKVMKVRKKMSYDEFKWMCESSYEEIEKGVQIYAPPGSNYFVNPATEIVSNTAPFFYKEVTGDFVFRAKVRLDFISTYDAAVLLALDNEKLWAKACFEYTDLDTHSVVTVMTKGRSDDANGIDIDGNEVWMQLARRDNVFAVHYSLDGDIYKMARLAYLPVSKTIKVGFEAQSPMGEGGMRYFTDISLVNTSLDNIRNGNM